MTTARKTELIDTQSIIIGSRVRSLNEGAIAPLMASLSRIGMRTPITVRTVSDDDFPENILVTGLHRLEAAKRLGWEEIECFVVDHESEDLARMWEIAENLHRAELTVLERDEQVSEWVRLSSIVSSQVETKSQVGRPESGVRRAARELGIESSDAHRAGKVAGLSDDAKQAARDVGLDDNRSALLRASAQAPEKQAAAIREIAEAKASRIDGDIKNRAAQELAEWIVAHANGNDLDAVKANLFASGAKNIAVELTNLIGQSIMDRRFS
jgi:ParB family chromosome partitioning protein